MADLWIIEAPGKKEILARSLDRLGHRAEVIATSGYIMDIDGKGLGIDVRLDDVGRAPKSRDTIERIREAAKNAAKVYIATDADQAGDVIALDVADVIRDIKPNPVRVRVTGLDQDAITQSLARAEKVTRTRAAPGRARAIVDRLLGVAFTSQSGSTGRTQAAALSSVAMAPKGFADLYTIVAPCTTGGGHFYLETTPDHVIGADDLEMLLASPIRPVKPGDPCLAGFQPRHFGDILLAGSDVAAKAGMPRPISEVGAMCQELYTAGMMSYPRSGLHCYSAYALKRIDRNTSGLSHEVVANKKVLRADSEISGHDAPHPLLKPAQSSSPGLVTPNNLLTEVQNGAIRAANLWPAQIPEHEDLIDALMGSGLKRRQAVAMASRRWLRWDGAPPPGLRKPEESSKFTRPADAALLDLMLQRGIGRPGSWADLPGQITGKSMVEIKGGSLVLTAKGQAALDATPGFLRDPDFSAMVERICETAEPGPDEAPWRNIAIAVMKATPPEAQARIRVALLDAAKDRTTTSTPAPPSTPTIEDLGIDTSVRAPSRAPTMAPTPR